ncbi:hypothetical protein DPSP01_012713 [Paraphaeosphaeria sporulosa]
MQRSGGSEPLPYASQHHRFDRKRQETIIARQPHESRRNYPAALRALIERSIYLFYRAMPTLDRARHFTLPPAAVQRPRSAGEKDRSVDEPTLRCAAGVCNMRGNALPAGQ